MKLQKKIGIVRVCLIVLFAGIIVFGLYKIWETAENTRKSQIIQEQMNRYRPTAPQPETQPVEAFINPKIVEAREFNPDIAGWIQMEGTRIDYPFVQAKDNDYYLRRDINGDYAFPGTLFMDYRHDKDFRNFTTVIYGHNMEDGTMFSDIRRYDAADFFAENTTGYIYLERATYKLEVFAYMRITDSDRYIYNMGDKTPDEILVYIKETAWRYRDISLTQSDRIVVLSTCTRIYDIRRNVVVARLVKIQ